MRKEGKTAEKTKEKLPKKRRKIGKFEVKIIQKKTKILMKFPRKTQTDSQLGSLWEKSMPFR